MQEISVKSRQGIRCAADILRASKQAVVLTGAGLSTPSGIPDFRSTGSGLWAKQDPFEVASLAAFRYQPERFFNWMRPLANGIRMAQPNPAHLALARLETGGFVQTIITQNIDGLHQRAGSKHVYEVHGTLNTLSCVRCFHQFDAEPFLSGYIDEGRIPHCPECDGLLKPDVVLFGEQLPVRTWLKAQDASKHCDLMIVAGSSLEVLPVAGLPMRAVENGAHLIVINHTQTYIDVRADVVLSEDVAEIIPCIVNEVMGEPA